MPDSQQVPDGSSTALPRVLHKPLSRALLSESWAQAAEAKRMERAGDDLQLTYEAYAAGEPCRACGRALLGEPALGTDEESLALIDADNAEFRAEHTACNMGVWRLENNRVEHCHLCCPFPPLSPTQRDELTAPIPTLIAHRPQRHLASGTDLPARRDLGRAFPSLR